MYLIYRKTCDVINFGQDSIITVERYHYSPQENKILLMDKYGNEVYQKE